MAREKFATLTEQMYYILLSLLDECCGVDIMEKVSRMTGGRIAVGPGTLYTLLGQFVKAGIIEETQVEGRKKSYRITAVGMQMLREEYGRLKQQVIDGQGLLEDKE